MSKYNVTFYCSDQTLELHVHFNLKKIMIPILVNIFMSDKLNVPPPPKKKINKRWSSHFGEGSLKMCVVYTLVKMSTILDFPLYCSNHVYIIAMKCIFHFANILHWFCTKSPGGGGDRVHHQIFGRKKWTQLDLRFCKNEESKKSKINEKGGQLDWTSRWKLIQNT